MALCALVLAGCATKTAAPSTRGAGAVQSQATTPKPKRPFRVNVISWIGALPNVIPRKAKPPQAQVPRLIGVIKTVNTDDRFVLIDATAFQGAEAGGLPVPLRCSKEKPDAPQW